MLVADKLNSWLRRPDFGGTVMKRLMIPVLLVVFLALALPGVFRFGFDDQPEKDAPVALEEGLWKELADKDAASAYKAIIKMVADPESAVPYLREKLLAEPMPSPKDLADLIADLDKGSFAKREAASRTLAKMGKSAEWALIRSLHERNTPETQQRIEQILKKLETRKPTVIELRIGRALEVIERTASVKAKQVLKDLVKERPGTLVAQEALKGLARLDGHPTLARSGQSKTAQPAEDKTIYTGRCFRFRYSAFAPDSKQVLVSEQDNRVFLWDISTGKLRREVPSNVTNGAVAWSPNGKLAATGRHFGEIDIWDAENWELVRTLAGHPSIAANRKYPDDAKVFHLRFSADSRHLISGGRDESISQWDVDTGERIDSLALPTGIGNVDAVSPDGEFIAYHRARGFMNQTDLVIWDTSRNKEVVVFDSKRPSVMTGTFSSTGRFFLAGQRRSRP